MSRWMFRTVLSLGASAAVLIGLAGPAGAAPSQPADPAPEGLPQAVRRDLGLDWPEYLARGAAAERAAGLDSRLQGTPGYRGVVLQGRQVVVSGEGSRVTREARNFGARVTTGGRKAASAEPMLQKYLAEVGAEGLGAVETTADGWQITVDRPEQARSTPSGKQISPQQFAAANPGVALRTGRPATPRVGVLGGQGWTGGGTLCSVGFAAFDPSGRPEMLTAGHCSRDNSVGSARLESDVGVFLGNRTFSQFGGPGNTSNAQSNPGTDISMFGPPNQDLLPLVDTYGGRSKVTGVTAPVSGAPVCTAGRTTRRWNCSTIEGTGTFAVLGFGGANDVRYVQGFSSRLTTLGGDSGGSMVTGLKAIGVLSAGDNYAGIEYSFGATLDVFRSLNHQIELWLASPAAAPSVPGSRVSGRVPVDSGDTLPPGTQVRIATNATTNQVPLAADGTFTFTAPADGSSVTLTTVNGFSTSAQGVWTTSLGSPTGERICGLRDGGCFQPFTGGLMYSSPASGSHLVRGAIYAKWSALGWERGRLGYPLTDQRCGLREGGCYQAFQGGRIYWSPKSGAHQVWGSIGENWDRSGIENGLLGYPIGDESCGLRDGGCFQAFQGGLSYWSPNSGAHWIRGAIYDEWASLGWERGRLGYPLTDQRCGLREGGCYQAFQGGRIYWSPKSGAHQVWGSIGENWDRSGIELGPLGYPTGEENCGLRGGGCFQTFQGGMFYWSPVTGAHWIRGAILGRWSGMGWEGSQLGYPVTDENCGLRGGGCFQVFTGGSIYWSPASGSQPVWGAIRDYWGRNGWEGGRFGYPTAGENCRDVGSPGMSCSQPFQGGTINWSAAGGANG